jgi:hypothetical protein
VTGTEITAISAADNPARAARVAIPRHSSNRYSHDPVTNTENLATAAGRLRSTQRTEGTFMDPDLDPNLQHWQDRLDNLQWVEGSLVALLDSIPT